MEFGRALVEKLLADDSTSYRYFGFLNETSKHAMNEVYESWDNAASSPPKTRPRDDSHSAAPPDLQILGFHNGQPFWPEMLNTRFDEATEEHQQLKSLHEKFIQMFPSLQQSPGTSTTTEARTPGRAGGQCDYSIDAGAQPVDITRQIELSLVKNEDFTDQRLGNILGVKVAVITTRMNLCCFHFEAAFTFSSGFQPGVLDMWLSRRAFIFDECKAFSN